MSSTSSTDQSQRTASTSDDSTTGQAGRGRFRGKGHRWRRGRGSTLQSIEEEEPNLSSSGESLAEQAGSRHGQFRGRGRGRGRGGRGRGGRGRGRSAVLREEEEEGSGRRAATAPVERLIAPTGRRRRSRASRQLVLSREDEDRIEEQRREREEEIDHLIQGMSLEDHVQVTRLMLRKQPGVLFDVLLDFQHQRYPPAPTEVPQLRWCTCGNCVQMPTVLENKCCGQVPADCTSLLPHFRHYCLDAGYLRIHRQYREEITVLGQLREPGDDNREFRYAAYRHYIFWQHGSLGGGNRRVIPSCCVMKIRETFPDPHGQYRGYTPGV